MLVRIFYIYLKMFNLEWMILNLIIIIIILCFLNFCFLLDIKSDEVDLEIGETERVFGAF